MPGLIDLDLLLASLQPTLDEGLFVFITLPAASYGAGGQFSPIAAVQEAEGLSLIVSQDRAEGAGLPYEGVFRRLTLQVPSSLSAVGLTAAVAGRLADAGISANVLAGYHHDHVFVPEDRAEEALAVLETLSTSVQARQPRPPTAHPNS